MPTLHETITASLDRMSPPAGLQSSRHFQANVTGFNGAVARVKTEWDKLAAQKNRGGLAPADETDYNKYAEELAKGLPEIENGVIDVAHAFQAGDPLAEAESILNLCASMVTTIASLAGPEGTAVGAVLGALFSMISSILALFEPPPVPLIDQIEQLLKQEQANNQYQQLRVALWGFQSLEDAWKQGLWPVVNLQNGPEVQQLRAADAWLSSEENQTDGLFEKWAKVLDLQCQVFIAAIKAVPLALSALDKQVKMPAAEKRNAGGLLRIGIQTMARNQLAFLLGVAPVIQKRGIYWIVDSWKNLLCTFDQVGKPASANNGGVHLSVAAAVAESQKTEPTLQVFALDGVEGSVWHGGMQWPGGPVYGWDKMKDEPAGCLDVSAMPGDNYAMFYWVARKDGITCGTLDKTLAPKGFTVPESQKAASVRAVHRPKGIGDDPDENKANPRALRGIDHMVYVGLENSHRIYAVADAGANRRQGFILCPKPLNSYFGIGVDRRFLWVFGSSNIYRASHTSVIKAMGQGSTPNWLSCLPPGSWNASFAACDDHSLCSWDNKDHTPQFVAYGSNYWTDSSFYGLSYNGPLRPVQMLKLPSYRWALIGGLIESLRLHSNRAA